MNSEALIGTQVMRSKGSAEVILESPRRNDLSYLKLQWISAKDENLKRNLSEKIRKG